MRYEQFTEALKATGGRTSYIGNTRYGYPIPVVSKGNTAKGGVLIVGGVHAREYITVYLLLDLITKYVGDYGVDVVPCLNIDGCTLAEYGMNEFALSARDRLRLIRLNDGSTYFGKWKANLAGVDINVNFDAGWGEGESNKIYPGPSDYVGPYPESEPETRAIKELMLSRDKDYALVVAYHSKGEEVYWGFRKDLRYKEEAKSVADYLGYELKSTPRSSGGLKDYWTAVTGRLGLTVEVGSDRYEHPYPLSELGALAARHADVIEQYTLTARKLWTTKYGL